MRLKKEHDALTLREWILLDGVKFSKRQLYCLWNYYWIGKTQREIACELDICRPVVSIHLKRARTKISQYLGLST